MSLTSTSSSWSSSNVVARISPGSCQRPAKISVYERATRAGVSFNPGRSGSSPTAIRSSRTAASARPASNPTPSPPSRRGVHSFTADVQPGTRAGSLAGKDQQLPRRPPALQVLMRARGPRERVTAADAHLEPALGDRREDVGRPPEQLLTGGDV